MLKDALIAASESPGARLLRQSLDYALTELGFEADAFVHELADS